MVHTPSPRTVSKIEILDTNYKDKLLSVIPPENLPVELVRPSPHSTCRSDYVDCVAHLRMRCKPRAQRRRRAHTCACVLALCGRGGAGAQSAQWGSALRPVGAGLCFQGGSCSERELKKVGESDDGADMGALCLTLPPIG